MTIQPKHIKHLYEDVSKAANVYMLILLQQMDKAEAKEQGNLKRKKKLVSAFKDVMKGEKAIGMSLNYWMGLMVVSGTTSTWIDARPLLMGYKEFDAIDDEQEREKAFNEYPLYSGA